MDITKQRFAFLLFCTFCLTHGVWGKSKDLVDENKHYLNSLQNEEKDFESRLLLPKNLIPTHYIVEIQPFLEDSPFGRTFTAKGKITISAKCEEQTQTITLHQLNLEIDERSLKVTEKTNQTTIPLVSYQYDAVNQFYIIETSEILQTGNEYEIYMEYVAPIPDNIFYGIYRSTYKNADGQNIPFAAVHFEPTHARRAFPIFDEPNLKATWTISILRLDKHNTLANMDLNRSEPIVGMTNWTRDIYNPTPVMSSYIICFAVSDYTFVQADVGFFNKPVKIWASPPLIAEGAGDYAKDYSAKVLGYFEDYFGIEYLMPKMDKLAIKDFAIGAMENPGLNTYRESRLLWLEGVSPMSDKLAMSSTISHEINHQHMGNLVTPDWWSDSWMKEGFATYFGPLGADAFHPEYNLKNSMINNVIQRAMQVDVLETSHPMHNNVTTPGEISSHFSPITYQKAGSVIIMMNTFLGEKAFREALVELLTRYAFKNANQDQYFEICQEVVESNSIDLDGQTMDEIMKTWTMQTGFPLIRVTRNLETLGQFSLQQEVFHLDAGIPIEPKFWKVPVFYVHQDNMTHLNLHWLKTENAENIIIPDMTNMKFLLVNPGQRGYYRVLYDDLSLILLKFQLMIDHTKIDQLSRSALIDDNLNLAFAGFTTLSNALDIANYLNKEMNLVPWASFLTNMDYSNKMLARTAVYYQFRKWMLGLIRPPLSSIGYDFKPTDMNQIGDKIILRANLIQWACNLGDSGCLTWTRQSMADWMANSTNPSIIYPDLQPFVYCHAIAGDSQGQVWDFILDQYSTFDRYLLPDVMLTNLIRALTCSKESSKINKLLNILIASNSVIKSEHRVGVLQALASNPIGPDIMFNFIRENLKVIIMRYGQVGGPNFIANAITTLSNHFNTQIQNADVQKFYQDNLGDLQSVEVSFTNAFKNIEKNIQWIGKNYNQFATFLPK